MQTETISAELQHYADAVDQKVLSTQADLPPLDHAHPGMLPWCRRQKNLVVLRSGNILTSEPNSRVVQNCKIVMQDKSIVAKQILPATAELVHFILENAVDETDVKTKKVDDFSTQQQRLRMLVKEALNVGASDIHMEVRQDMARIRFRTHGELYLHAEWLPKLGREVASVAFNKETDHAISHFNPLVPQNASMPLKIDGSEVRLRLASLPAHGGFDVVMRILATANERNQNLSQLGYSESQINLIKKAVNLSHGAVIVAGPTGSGKTTTLASCMQLVKGDRKLYTIEDPVEKKIRSATQVPVNTEHYDRSFASMARTVLRMDPDVVVLGEMRDEDTASVMMRAAITGHLVFSTLHTNSAPDIITRLLDLGVSSSLLATPHLLDCLICQRLVAKLCEKCAQPVTENPTHKPFVDRWKQVYGDKINKVLGRGENAKTCSACNGLGISGRTIVAEIIWVDEMSRQFIQNSDMLGWQKYLKQQGWQTYQDQLVEMVGQGICDPLDAEKLIGEIGHDRESEKFEYK